ncbi:hypothetical protein FGO68_gene13775 [Halteria grandinella]|uniref:Uncharacterized protein n=1 Tax=Halteria grandinella TaxID=5974 RepID=A0A8J8P708_HALGN|nr:hypothetical protein FGO68_gene13775 [Halteria grandinella]
MIISFLLYLLSVQKPMPSKHANYKNRLILTIVAAFFLLNIPKNESAPYSEFPLVYGEYDWLATVDFEIVAINLSSNNEIIVLAIHTKLTVKVLSIMGLSIQGHELWRYSRDIHTLYWNTAIQSLPNNMIEVEQGVVFWNEGPSSLSQFTLYEYASHSIIQVVTTTDAETLGHFIIGDEDYLYVGINFVDGTFAIQKYTIQSGVTGFVFVWQKRCCGTIKYRMSALLRLQYGTSLMTIGQSEIDRLSFSMINSNVKDGNWIYNTNSGENTFSFFVTELPSQIIDSGNNFKMALAQDQDHRYYACAMDPITYTPKVFKFFINEFNTFSQFNSYSLKTRLLQYGSQMCHGLHATSSLIIALFQEYEYTKELGVLHIYQNTNSISYYKISTLTQFD